MNFNQVYFQTFCLLLETRNTLFKFDFSSLKTYLFPKRRMLFLGKFQTMQSTLYSLSVDNFSLMTEKRANSGLSY